VIAGNLAQVSAHARRERAGMRRQRRRVLEALDDGRRSSDPRCAGGRADADPAQLVERARGNGGGVAKRVSHLGIIEVGARGQLRQHPPHVGAVKIDPAERFELADHVLGDRQHQRAPVGEPPMRRQQDELIRRQSGLRGEP
jgi:hypothetical protein